MQIKQSKKKIELIFAFLFFWIIFSVIIAYKNLNFITKENEKLELAVNQFQQLEKIQSDIDNIAADQTKFIQSLQKKYKLDYEKDVAQLFTHTSVYSTLVNSEFQKANFDTLNSKLLQKKSLDSTFFNQQFLRNENRYSALLFDEIKWRINALKINHLKNIANTEKTQLAASKNNNLEVLAFRILFFSILVLGFFLLRKNITQLQINVRNKISEKDLELKNIFDSFADAFFTVNNNWDFIYINKKAAEMYSIPIEDIYGKNIWEITPQLKASQFYVEVKKAKVKNEATRVELFHPETNQWFENWIYPMENGVSVYYREISEKKNQELNLIATKKEQEILNNRFILISQATNESIWDWNLKTNEIWGNDNYYKLINYTGDDKFNYSLFTERMHPDDLKTGNELFENVVKEKQTKFTSEFRFLTPAKNWIVLLNKQNILYTSEGLPYRILGSLQDITLQKSIQEQIVHEKGLADVLINSLPGLFYMFNKEGKYVRWNKNLELISGYSAEEIYNIHPTAFIPENKRALVAAKIANVFIVGSDNIEVDFYTKNKQSIPYYFTGAYVKYNNEDCLMGIGFDISDKVKVENELRDFSIRIQNIREEERTNIAREIHDELGQQLTGLKMDLSWIHKKLDVDDIIVNEKISDALKIIDLTIQSVRRIATELRPSILDDLGLIAALEWQCEEFQNRFNINASFFSNVSFVEIEKDTATALFRIYQESLTNVLRHSGANKTTTSLNVEHGSLKLQISDNGIGFDLDKIKVKKTLGILGMRERANMINADYSISSNNTGTTILVIVPLHA